MTKITKKIDNILRSKNLSRKELCKLIGCTDGALNQMIRQDRPFSANILEKLLPILEVSREEFEIWIIADKYSKEVLELAIQTKKAFPYKRKSILTTNIDNVLREINMSESVIERIAKVLDIPQDEILSWIIADNNSLQVLESAYSCALYN
jgi:transcriptional regulator with XRE-family HTH domain